MKKKIGDLTLREVKKNCKQDKYECNICNYCKFKELCFHKVFELLHSLDKEIEVENNE